MKHEISISDALEPSLERMRQVASFGGTVITTATFLKDICETAIAGFRLKELSLSPLAPREATLDDSGDASRFLERQKKITAARTQRMLHLDSQRLPKSMIAQRLQISLPTVVRILKQKK